MKELDVSVRLQVGAASLTVEVKRSNPQPPMLIEPARNSGYLDYNNNSYNMPKEIVYDPYKNYFR